MRVPLNCGKRDDTYSSGGVKRDWVIICVNPAGDCCRRIWAAFATAGGRKGAKNGNFTRHG